MPTELRVLIIEDSEDDAELMEFALREGEYSFVSQVVGSESAYLAALVTPVWDVILCDHSLPGFDSIKALELLQAQGLDIPFIIVSGAIGEEAAVAAMKAGAADYVMKDRLARLGPAIDREVREAEVRREKNRAEAALLLNEARLAGIVGSAMDAIISIGADQRVVLFNQAAEKMFGYTTQEILGQPIDLLLPERYRSVHQDHIEAFAQTGVTSRIMGDLNVLAGRRRNGEEFPIEATISQIDVAGQKYFTVIVRDVTERVRSQEALQHSEAWFRALLENSYDAVAVIDTEGVFTYVDESIRQVLGYDPATLLGTNGFSLVHPQDLKEVQAAFFQLLQPSTGRVEAAFRARHADGSWRWLDLTGADLLNDSRIGGVVVNFRDVTERKNAEDALRQSEARLAGIIGTAMDAVITLDADQRIVMFNPAAEQMFGYTSTEVLEKPIDLMLPERYRERHRSHVEQFGKTGVTGRVMGALTTLTALRRNGEEFPIEATISQTDISGRRYYTVIVRDVTERVLAQQQMAASLHEKEVLLRELHHRVKNNLHIVSSILSLQARATVDPEAAAGLQEAIMRVQTIALVDNELYGMPDVGSIDFPAYVQRLLEKMELVYVNQPGRISLNLISEPMYLDLETAVPCGLLLHELVTNAIKHAFPSGEAGVIEVRLQPGPDDRTTIVVKDDGVGLPPDLDYLTPTSMGLDIVQALVKQLGGTLRVEIEGGTCFGITFTARDNAERSTAATQQHI